MSNHLTLHIINSIPYSNLNRDDSGAPKRIKQGNVQRSVLSSQSIKRGIRLAYQSETGDNAFRSKRTVENILYRALDINPDLDEKKALDKAKKLIENFTGEEVKGDKGETKTAVAYFMSDEELETAARHIAAGKKESNECVLNHTTGSLSIAAFGRMFASKPEHTTEASLSVSPAVTTHASTISTDYFTAVDDIQSTSENRGSAHLGINQLTSGVFYRTISIDRKQLKESWSGLDAESAKPLLSAFINACIYGLPSGKSHSTAPYTMPALVYAEEQRCRVAYDFETPIQPAYEGGFMDATLDSLESQMVTARDFDPHNFEGLNMVSGTHSKAREGFDMAEHVVKQDLCDRIADWILDA